MSQILSSYPIEEVLIIIFAFCAAIYGLVKANDFMKTKETEYVSKKSFENALPEVISQLQSNDKRQDERMNKQDKKIEQLISSDRAKIKGEILKQYQYFSRKGEIDLYSWEYLHQLYDNYKAEGGNSWVKEIMAEIDSMPRSK